MYSTGIPVCTHPHGFHVVELLISRSYGEVFRLDNTRYGTVRGCTIQGAQSGPCINTHRSQRHENMHPLQSAFVFLTFLIFFSAALPQVSNVIADKHRAVLMRRTAGCVNDETSQCPGIPSESRLTSRLRILLSNWDDMRYSKFKMYLMAYLVPEARKRFMRCRDYANLYCFC